MVFRQPPYQARVRLCIVLVERWAEIDAEYYHPGRSILRETPRRILDLVYSWAIERVPHDKLDEWLADLVDLLPWQDADSDAAEEIESASFFAMQAKG